MFRTAHVAFELDVRDGRRVLDLQFLFGEGFVQQFGLKGELGEGQSAISTSGTS